MLLFGSLATNLSAFADPFNTLHSNVVTGKAYFMKLFRERAQELGDEFVLRDFIDEFLEVGIIPMSLIRWEMTGNSDDVTLVTEDLPSR